MAIRWWEVPEDLPLFENGQGHELPTRPGWTFRVVEFDAQGAQAAWLEALNLQPSHRDKSGKPFGLSGPPDVSPKAESARSEPKERHKSSKDIKLPPDGPQSRLKAPGSHPSASGPSSKRPMRDSRVFNLGACAPAARELKPD